VKGHTERSRDARPLRAKKLPDTKSEVFVLLAGFVLTAGLAALVVFAAATA
jgi:hypothetical protein